MPLPRNLLMIAGFSLIGFVSSGQVNAQTTQFEAASIKPIAGNANTVIKILPGRLIAVAPLHVLIQAAYNLQPFQLADGPGWIGSDLYEIDARTVGEANQAQILLMLQTLLKDRFQLQVHRESRKMPVYALLPARGGLKLPPSRNETCAGESDLVGPLAIPGGRVQIFFPNQVPASRCGAIDVMLGAWHAHMQGNKMPEFARALSRMFRRAVTDQTGFSGAFDIRLDFLPDEATAALPPPPPGGDGNDHSIFTALQQLGLRLESATGPVDVLVIDHVERPTEN